MDHLLSARRVLGCWFDVFGRERRRSRRPMRVGAEVAQGRNLFVLRAQKQGLVQRSVLDQGPGEREEVMNLVEEMISDGAGH